MQKSTLRTGDLSPNISEVSPSVTETLHDECAAKFQKWVRRNIPTDTRKRLARALGTSENTVDVWLDPRKLRLPNTTHLLSALKTFGPSFAAEVLGPCGDWTRSLSFTARAEKIRNEIEALSRDFEKVARMGQRMDVAADFEVALNKSKAALEKAKLGLER